MRSIIIGIWALLVLTASCRHTDNGAMDREMELRIELLEQQLDLREKEMEIRERELALREAELSNSPLPLTEVYQQVKKAVYLVTTKKQFGTVTGSAFLVDPSGIAISNYHVFQNASEVIVTNEVGESFMVTEILDQHPEEDYIIFRIGPNNGDLPYLELSDGTPEIGEKCFTVGNPKGLTQSLSDGLISAFRENYRIIQTTTEITHGNSGGPLFNERGQVCGITSSGYQKSNLNFAINIHSLPIKNHLQKEGGKMQKLSTYSLLHLMDEYYEGLIKEDLNQVCSSYNSTLIRYHNKFNINDFYAVADHIAFLKDYDVVQARIVPHSIAVNYTGKQYFLSYQLDWKLIRRADGTPLEYTLQTIVEIDPNGCINSIYDNILTTKQPLSS